MKLLIDIGNTATKFASLQNKDFNYLGRIFNSEINESNLKGIFNTVKDFEDVYISSVNPNVNKKIEELLKINPHYIDVNYVDTSFIEIDKKEELGSDLLCDVVAGRKIYGNKTAIIDLGTATKVLFIDENGKFSSCAIFLGYQKSKEILSKSTALLPNVKNFKVKPISECHNTLDVINSSAYYSQLDSINGIIERYEKEKGYTLKRVFTGGNAYDFLNEIGKENYDEYLVLKGIAILLN